MEAIIQLNHVSRGRDIETIRKMDGGDAGGEYRERPEVCKIPYRNSCSHDALQK